MMQHITSRGLVTGSYGEVKIRGEIVHHVVGLSQPAPAQTPQVVEVLSDSEDEEPAQAATPAADGQVAQLMDMGFTPEQAAQVLPDCSPVC